MRVIRALAVCLTLVAAAAPAPALELTAQSNHQSRLSIGAIVTARADGFFLLPTTERTQDFFYNSNHDIVFFNPNGTIHSQHQIASYGGNRWGNISGAWSGAGVPPDGTVYEIRARDPAKSVPRWKIDLVPWYSAIGNGSGWALSFMVDRSAAQDGSNWEVLYQFAPCGTPGQNGCDSEVLFKNQVIRWISSNTLRSPPRPQDGNILDNKPHNGTDASARDVVGEFGFQVDGDSPVPWSILFNQHVSMKDSAGNIATLGMTYWRVVSNQAGNVQGEFCVLPSGTTYKWVFGPTGFYRESADGQRYHYN